MFRACCNKRHTTSGQGPSPCTASSLGNHAKSMYHFHTATGARAVCGGKWLRQYTLWALACVIIGLFPTCSSAQNTLLWFSQGRPTIQALQAVDLLSKAASDGLEPQDYNAQPLRNALDRAWKGPEISAAATEQLDTALTDSMQHYLNDLHRGRITPEKTHQDFRLLTPTPFDAAMYLSTALAENRLVEAVRQASPHNVIYASLHHALAQYRQISLLPTWRDRLPLLPGKTLLAGQPYAGTHMLGQRLIALGDLPAGTVIPERYEGVLIDGVRSFQQRHGLLVDGVIGNATMTQLEIRPAQRIRQIELSLERLRWTPLFQTPRMILVNIPEFMLRAYEVKNNKADVLLQMNVIVGRSKLTQTPIMDGEIQNIEFSPYWNVPRSIVISETLPRLRRDPAYFQRQGFEFVTHDGSVLRTASQANIDALQRGELRIRQRPGPHNALGDIKFIFPNNQSIYLHHTPAVGLFNRDQRDLSHGCVRVQDPTDLAQFVLQQEPEWTRTRIQQAMTLGKSRTIRVLPPVPVLITYSTVVVKDDKVYFYPDIYGRDSMLDKALQQRVRVAPLPEARQPTAEIIRPALY